MSNNVSKCIGMVLLAFLLGWTVYQESLQTRPLQVVSFDSPLVNVQAEIGFGTVAGHTYSNDYFGLTIPLPEDWYVSSREETEELIRLGKAVVSGKEANPKLKVAMEVPQWTTLQLLSAFQHPPGTPGVEMNPSLIVMAERVRHLPGIRSGAEYCEVLKKNLAMSALKPETGEVQGGFKIGSLNAHRLEIRSVVGATVTQQRYYATRYKDYVLGLIITYATDEELQVMKKVLADIKAGEPRNSHVRSSKE